MSAHPTYVTSCPGIDAGSYFQGTLHLHPFAVKTGVFSGARKPGGSPTHLSQCVQPQPPLPVCALPYMTLSCPQFFSFTGHHAKFASYRWQVYCVCSLFPVSAVEMSQGSMHEQPLSVRTNGTGCGSIPFSRSSWTSVGCSSFSQMSHLVHPYLPCPVPAFGSSDVVPHLCPSTAHQAVPGLSASVQPPYTTSCPMSRGANFHVSRHSHPCTVFFFSGSGNR
mmetsp:Transcript_1596/g.3632  ORF Transcript_1596/g.3632 Transcript_1596/m.3632 type:complete len:222 (-) Transcript_1596:1591-2256(-)